MAPGSWVVLQEFWKTDIQQPNINGILTDNLRYNVNEVRIKVLSYLLEASSKITTSNTEYELIWLITPLKKIWIKLIEYVWDNTKRINNLLWEYWWKEVLLLDEIDEVKIDWISISDVIQWMDEAIKGFMNSFITRVEQIIERRRLFNEIQDNKIKIVELENLLSYDYLTWAKNKRAYDTLLSNAYYLFENQKLERITVMLIDLDKFKSINDTFWHWAGDYVLRKISELMQKYAKKYKWEFCRLWWEELWFIFQNKTSEEVFEIWEELQNEIITTIFLEDYETLTKYRASITWWVKTIDNSNKHEFTRIWQLTKLADDWTYTWKRLWRQRIVINDWTPKKEEVMRSYNKESSWIDIEKTMKWVGEFLPDLLVAIFWNQKDLAKNKEPIFNLSWISSAHFEYAYLIYKIFEKKWYWEYDWLQSSLNNFLSVLLKVNMKSSIFTNIDNLLENWDFNELNKIVKNNKKYQQCPHIDAFLDYLFS